MFPPPLYFPFSRYFRSPCDLYFILILIENSILNMRLFACTQLNRYATGKYSYVHKHRSSYFAVICINVGSCLVKTHTFDWNNVRTVYPEIFSKNGRSVNVWVNTTWHVTSKCGMRASERRCWPIKTPEHKHAHIIRIHAYAYQIHNVFDVSVRKNDHFLSMLTQYYMRQGCVAVMSTTWIASVAIFGVLVLPRGGYYFNGSGLLACDPFFARASLRYRHCERGDKRPTFHDLLPRRHRVCSPRWPIAGNYSLMLSLSVCAIATGRMPRRSTVRDSDIRV